MAATLFDAGAKSSMSLSRSCRTATHHVRTFTSSSCLRVGPESPNYIDVPKPIQPVLPSIPKAKGTLPVPRDIFPHRRPDKPTKAYLDAATTEPSEKEHDPNDLNFNYNEWKRKMAVARRNNLREGLLELYKRKQQTDHSKATRSNQKQNQRNRILRQPPRDDEQLTSPSITQVMQPMRSSVLPDPDREERLALARLNVEAKEQAKQMERQDALHTLYMNARTFITTEEQLAAEIDRVFPEGDNPAWANDQRPGDNIWNLGLPQTVQSMVDSSKRGDLSQYELVQKRVQKIAEELTGGKM